MTFHQRVMDMVKQIPRGKVTTYKEIANALQTKAYQAVGQALRMNKLPIIIPCHRIVTSNGRLGGYYGKPHNKKKKKLLESEGIVFDGEKIVGFKNVLYYYNP